ncbi:MAG: hypothetical protein MJZ90_04105 [Bacteroidales bacterium]|nr:hypothetical protein [Bacteroidales bacterium]
MTTAAADGLRHGLEVALNPPELEGLKYERFAAHDGLVPADCRRYRCL